MNKKFLAQRRKGAKKKGANMKKQSSLRHCAVAREIL
jgi:hypothetical protein